MLEWSTSTSLWFVWFCRLVCLIACSIPVVLCFFDSILYIFACLVAWSLAAFLHSASLAPATKKKSSNSSDIPLEKKRSCKLMCLLHSVAKKHFKNPSKAPTGSKKQKNHIRFGVILMVKPSDPERTFPSLPHPTPLSAAPDSSRALAVPPLRSALGRSTTSSHETRRLRLGRGGGLEGL